MSVRIYEDGGVWMPADDGGWLPGLYETREAAELAAAVAASHYDELATMADYSVRGVGHAYRPITAAELAARFPGAWFRTAAATSAARSSRAASTGCAHTRPPCTRDVVHPAGRIDARAER